MALVDESVHIEADPATVWSVLTEWEGQPRWMRDARSVVVLSPQRHGTGVVLRCVTNIAAGVKVRDDMTVTHWDPPSLLQIRHLGPWFRGVGAFELTPTADGTHLRWWEEVTAPMGRLGEAGAIAVMPLVARVFRRSLAQLRNVVETRNETGGPPGP